MPKPATLPRWATDLTNNDAPSSGQMDTGWTPSQTGVSDYDNWVKYWTYKWIEWIDAGVLTGTDLTLTGNLVVGGTVTVTGDTTVAGLAHTAVFTQSRPAAFHCIPGAAGVAIGNGPQIPVVVDVSQQVNFHTHGQRIGDRITAVKITALGVGGTTAPTVDMRRYESNNALVAVPHSAILSAGANNTDCEYTITPTTPVTLAEGRCLVLSFTPNGAGQSYFALSVLYDHPVV